MTNLNAMITSPQQKPRVPLFSLSNDEDAGEAAFAMGLDTPQDPSGNSSGGTIHDISLSQCRLESQFSRLRASSDASSSAPSDLTSWSTMTPSEPGSASGMMASKLAAKEQQLQTVNKTLEEFRKKLAALEAELSASKKRPREKKSKASAAQETMDTAGMAAEQPPNKRLSPDESQLKKSSVFESPVLTATTPDSISKEDEPPSPEKAGVIPLKPLPVYASLESIVCAYREGGFHPGVGNMTFGICVELIEDEIKKVDAWDRTQTKELQPAVISALKLIYPKRGSRWEQHECARSPSAAKKYWRKVLTKWKNMWAGEMLPKTAVPPKTSPTMGVIAERIREKIEKRESTKTATLSPAKSGSQPIPIVISDSDSSGGEAPAAKPEMDSSSSEKLSGKLAPGPKSYTREEMKSFAKMVRVTNHVKYRTTC